MIILAFVSVAKSGRHDEQVPHFNILALPNLFGGVVYSFMCHHSLPSIVTPMRDKSQVLRIVGMAFVSIIIVYLFLFVSCGLAFGTGVLDPITFNFPPERILLSVVILFALRLVCGCQKTLSLRHYVRRTIDALDCIP
jgi:amino acid permease